MQKKAIFISILVCMICHSVFSQSHITLEEAYAENSVQKLNRFFENWAKEIKPISDSELRKQNNSIKYAYKIFETLYDPHDVAKLGVKQSRYELYRNFHYFVISQDVNLYVADKVYWDESETDAFTIDEINKTVGSDSLKAVFINRIKNREYGNLIGSWGPYGIGHIDNSKKHIYSFTNFRPRITQVPGVTLYLTKKYEDELKKFLGNENIPFATGGAENIAQATGESKKRMTFIENFIKIAYGHWGGNWELKTPPSIHSITFDKDFKFAKVDYMLIYEGGTAFFSLENGNCKLLSAKINWRE
ncbi:hypothetical protein [Pedobacter sp. UYP24]